MGFRALGVLLATTLTMPAYAGAGRAVTPDAPDAAPTLGSLAAARGFVVGAGASDARELDDPAYAKLAATQYNAIEPENSMKMNALEPSQGVFNFSRADEVVRFAAAHGLKVTATAPVWDGSGSDYEGSNPAWLSKGNFTAEELKSILQGYITALMQHYHRDYPGVVNRWAVVSEATHVCDALCKGLGKDASGFPAYIALAYEDARAADPGVQLCYDDYGGEGLGKTSDTIYRLAKYLRSKGLIDCIGLEGQWEGVGVRGIPPAADLMRNIDRLGALGLSVYFSQVEIGLPVAQGVASEAELNAQAKAYSKLLSTCLSTAACKGFFTWGISDKYAFCYKAGMCAPLPFDANYRAKPAYRALKRGLGGENPR